jgi:hypothetical protein
MRAASPSRFCFAATFDPVSRFMVQVFIASVFGFISGSDIL